MKRRWLAVLLPLTLTACGYNTIQGLDEQASAGRRVQPSGTVATAPAMAMAIALANDIAANAPRGLIGDRRAGRSR